MKKGHLTIQSSSSGNASSSEGETSAETEEFSDEDHAYLITSVANLRRREIMNLQPLRTKSKEVPKLKERKRTNRNYQPLLGLYETKEMIQKQLMEDKTKIKTRNPKKQLISEEKWSQGTN